MLENRWSYFREKIQSRGLRIGFALGLGLALLSFGGMAAFRQTAHAGTAGVSPTIAPAKVAAATELSKSFEVVAKAVEPAVVNINTEQIIHNTAANNDDPFRQFFGDNSPFGSFPGADAAGSEAAEPGIGIPGRFEGLHPHQ